MQSGTAAETMQSDLNPFWSGSIKSKRIKWISSFAEITSSYGMPLIYWDIYTDSEQFGQIDRQNLSIRDALKLNSTTPLTSWRKKTNLYPSWCLTLISSRKSMITTVMPITCSIGIYGIKEEDTAKDAFIHLDKALYNAKNNGRNCVSL